MEDIVIKYCEMTIVNNESARYKLMIFPVLLSATFFFASTHHILAKWSYFPNEIIFYFDDFKKFCFL